ncbi:MAG: TIGR01777 family oxidoreductase [Phycisphaerae bacterium]|nr:TIGR01777 family oxidoreductase [Phycisphaerae bacterium]
MSQLSNRVVIAGGSGFLGRNLASALRRVGREVVILTRKPREARDGVLEVGWDARTVGEWKSSLDGAAAIVNLVGRSVDCRKTEANCAEILRSRVDATRAIGLALKELSNGPRVWVQMSTAHAYGDPPKDVCDENSLFGEGFAPMVGRAWEDAHLQHLPPGVRSVILRTSFVLGKRGGALPTLERLARFGFGGTIGTGEQGLSWLHERDMTALMVRAIDNEAMSGAYIATAPEPVSMGEFMRALRSAVGMPIGLPSPGWMIRMAAPIIGTDPELALLGRYCVSKRLREEAFEFEFPTLKSALGDLFQRKA